MTKKKKKKKKKVKPLGFACDLWCPFSNSAELFQSKVMWKFGLDWLKSDVYEFSRGKNKAPIRGGYMWPAMPIFEPGRAIPVKSRVKIWFRLVEPFRSYRVHKHKHPPPPKKKNHRRNWKQYPWKNSLPADNKMTKSQAQLKTIAFRKILFWADKKKTSY